MKLVLAGGEAWLDYFIRHGIKYMLFSFHYLRSAKDYQSMMAALRDYKDRNPGAWVMLDSGAFTFKVNGGTPEQIEEYSEEYIRYLQSEDAGVFDVIAELDLYDSTVEWGVACRKVDDLRERIIEAVGRKTMPVVWPELGFTRVQDTLKDPRYDWVAIASNAGKDLGFQKLTISDGHYYGKKVHGFGMTRLQTDFKYLRNYDSVDSTTWLRADKYGGTFIYQRGHLRILNHLQKDRRRWFRGYFRKIGLDPRKIEGIHMPHADHCPGPDSQTKDCPACKDQLEELRSSSLIAWRNMAEKWNREKVGPYKNHPQIPPSPTQSAQAAHSYMTEQTKPASSFEPKGLKKRKGGIRKKTAAGPFGGYRCPHYRDRPPSVAQNLACQSCPNQVTCLGLNGETETHALPEHAPSPHVDPGRGGEVRLRLLSPDQAAQAEALGFREGIDFTIGEPGADPARASGEVLGAAQPAEHGSRQLGHNHHANPTGAKQESPALPTQLGQGEAGDSRVSNPTPTTQAAQETSAAKEDLSGAETKPSPLQGEKDTPQEEGERMTASPPTSLETHALPPGERMTGSSPSTSSLSAAVLAQGRISGSPSSTSTRSAAVPPLEVNTRALRLPVVNNDGNLNLGVFRSSLPRVECNTCTLYDECPEARADAVCAYNEIFDQFDLRDAKGVKAAMQFLVEEDFRRTWMAMMQERVSTGGQIDPRVTAQMDKMTQRMTQYHNLMAPTPPPRQGPHVTVVSQGDAHVHAQEEGRPSILHQLFAPTPQLPSPQGGPHNRDGEKSSLIPPGAKHPPDLPSPQGEEDVIDVDARNGGLDS